MSQCISLSAQEKEKQKHDTTKQKHDTAKQKRITTKHKQLRQDTTRVKKVLKSIRNSRVSKRLEKSVTRKPSQITDPTLAIKSEDVFMPYQGKIIRNILVRQIGFEKSITDTTRHFKNTMAKIGNRLHNDSRESIIRDNLFIRENKPLSAFKMADNERYLRDLDFILDARFHIVKLKHTKDSVDVIVLTRDVFSVGGSFNPTLAQKTRFKLYDTNLAGLGQRVQFTGMWEDGRYPAFGYEVLYRKNSVAGTFVNATVGYTQLDNASSYGEEGEKAYYLRLDRPLVSPYTRFAGGMELSKNWSENFYQLNDTLFRDYRYNVNDFWIGYNIGANQNGKNRSRRFLAIRAFDQHFLRQPLQNSEQQNPIYNNKTFILGGITFFQQNFYTARYIYGFGRTEDVPYGHHVSLYAGWSRQLGLKRPYFGVEAEKAIVNKNGEFYTVALRTGAFRNAKLEDAVVLVSAAFTSRLMSHKKLLIRQSFNLDYTYIFNPRTSLPLDINNDLGIRGFVADSLAGTKRVHFNAETLVFTPIKLLGFRFAPFAFAEIAFLGKENQSLLYDKPFFGLGGGIRTRNENLVFGTVEVRVIYYPRTVEDISSVKISVSSNLRVKYSASFVKAPAFVRYN
ncbi:MAG: hypothetical protein ACOYXT_22745 [Bacteroidota bacterium]